MVHTEIIKAFGLTANDYTFKSLDDGLINKTYHLQHCTNQKLDYVLQQINTNVFKQPLLISQNIRLAAEYLSKHYPNYLFLKPVKTATGSDLYWNETTCWRMFPYIADTITITKAEVSLQVYEAAKQFGKLSKLLSGADDKLFESTIPGFHDLDARYKQFQIALKSASMERLEKSKNEIKKIISFKNIVDIYNSVKNDADFPTRIMHHDTKISNVLLNKKNYSGVCVIDLDTLMPGKIISDLGDMMRTYLSPVSEEETDLQKIEVREEFYEALMQGWLSEMRETLTKTEKELLTYSGKFIIYMQGMRFLTDYLNNDIYYPIKHSEHNLNRTKNQLQLLNLLIQNEKKSQTIVDNCLASKSTP